MHRALRRHTRAYATWRPSWFDGSPTWISNAISALPFLAFALAFAFAAAFCLALGELAAAGCAFAGLLGWELESVRCGNKQEPPVHISPNLHV